MRHALLASVLVLAAATGTARAKEQGHNVPKAELRTAPLPRPSGWIELAAPALRETVKVRIYEDDGSFDEESLATLDRLFAGKQGEIRAVDPRLYEILSLVYDHFGGKTVRLMSGYRPERQTSRHANAAAADIRVDGVDWREVHAYVITLDGGGMGIGRYPNQEFTHIDFRAPGEPSFRWVDWSTGGRKVKKSHHKPAKPAVRRAKRPNT